MTFNLTPDAQGRLTLTRPGEEDKSDVRLRRAFPWSGPGRHVSVRDAEGKELLLIDDLLSLPEVLRQTIERWLEDTSLTPRITSIQHLDVRFGYQQWNVTTDRGPIEFRVQEREDIRFLPDGRFRIKDADGNVYEMPRVDELDEPSRRAIEPLI
ncbi:MAG TPA: DUF1854 domain-containing protein [Humisphaera sp.]|nr:DUF1854 domain-containing protein [Humisphaera sp.]